MRVEAESFRKLYDRYHAQANFLFVYILEAHAKDEWPMPLGTQPCKYNQPTRIDERLNIASEYSKNFPVPFPMVVDTMSNDFERSYAVWPERFFVIENGVMAFIGQPEPDNGHLPGSLASWLSSRYEGTEFDFEKYNGCFPHNGVFRTTPYVPVPSPTASEVEFPGAASSA